MESKTIQKLFGAGKGTEKAWQEVLNGARAELGQDDANERDYVIRALQAWFERHYDPAKETIYRQTLNLAGFPRRAELSFFDVGRSYVQEWRIERGKEYPLGDLDVRRQAWELYSDAYKLALEYYPSEPIPETVTAKLNTISDQIDAALAKGLSIEEVRQQLPYWVKQQIGLGEIHTPWPYSQK